MLNKEQLMYLADLARIQYSETRKSIEKTEFLLIDAKNSSIYDSLVERKKELEEKADFISPIINRLEEMIYNF